MMRQDYKNFPYRENKPKPLQNHAMLLGIFIGLVCGLLIATIIILVINHSPSPFTKKNTDIEPTRSNPQIPDESSSLEKHHFEFYDILPENKDTGKLQKPLPKPKNEVKQLNKVIYLQAGAFHSLEQANSIKATLALLGFEAVIKKQNDLYMVKLGPYKTPVQAHEAATMLKDNGIITQLTTN